MIDRKLLAEYVRATQLTILHEINVLSKASEVLGQIAIEIDGPISDDYLKNLIALQLRYRVDLKRIFDEFDVDERNFWDKMLHIDKLTEEEEA